MPRTLEELVPFQNLRSPIEVFESEFRLGDLSFKMIGLTTYVKDLGEIVSSAVGTDEHTLDRAVFEMIERISVLHGENESKKEVPRQFILYDENGSPRGQVMAGNVFPVSTQESKWKYSQSNGVAANKGFRMAALSAVRELIERDRVLRSWYGDFVPKHYKINESTPIGEALSDFYDLRAYCFGQGVIGVVGFPRRNQRPLLLGWGSNSDLDLALSHALREAIQRIAFLWDEEAKLDFPSFRPSVDYHLDFYLNPKSFDQLKRWLEGDHFEMRKSYSPILSKTVDREEILYVDLTPSSSHGNVRVVKAFSEERVPLTFGIGNPKLLLSMDSSLGDKLGIHPIA